MSYCLLKSTKPQNSTMIIMNLPNHRFRSLVFILVLGSLLLISPILSQHQYQEFPASDSVEPNDIIIEEPIQSNSIINTTNDSLPEPDNIIDHSALEPDNTTIQESKELISEESKSNYTENITNYPSKNYTFREFICDPSDVDEVFLKLSTEDEVDPGSWRPIFEPEVYYVGVVKGSEQAESEYYWGVLKMLTAVSSGEERMMEEATAEIEAAAKAGNPHAQSVMGFLYGLGQMREKNRLKAFMYHYLASEGGNMQSKMALAYMYFKQEKYDQALKLYVELAKLTLSSFLIIKNLPSYQPTLISALDEQYKGSKGYFLGEEDEEFQIMKHLAENGNTKAMYGLGSYYYKGMSGVTRDWNEAVKWFLKAADKGEAKSLEILGEIYTKGSGVERNYTKAFEMLELASKRKAYPAYNGLGYLYAAGYGVDQNYTKAKECFNMAADNDGDYYLGEMYLNGIGVEKNALTANLFFTMSSAQLQLKSLFKLAQTYHSNCSTLPQNISTAIEVYKHIAEQGAWSSLNRWAMQAYVKGDVGKAFFLFSRLAEMGYKVAQSNAVWILEKHGDRNICFGESGFCSDAERQVRDHSLWLPHSL